MTKSHLKLRFRHNLLPFSLNTPRRVENKAQAHRDTTEPRRPISVSPPCPQFTSRWRRCLLPRVRSRAGHPGWSQLMGKSQPSLQSLCGRWLFWQPQRTWWVAGVWEQRGPSGTELAPATSWATLAADGGWYERMGAKGFGSRNLHNLTQNRRGELVRPGHMSLGTHPAPSAQADSATRVSWAAQLPGHGGHRGKDGAGAGRGDAPAPALPAPSVPGSCPLSPDSCAATTCSTAPRQAISAERAPVRSGMRSRAGGSSCWGERAKRGFHRACMCPLPAGAGPCGRARRSPARSPPTQLLPGGIPGPGREGCSPARRHAAPGGVHPGEPRVTFGGCHQPASTESQQKEQHHGMRGPGSAARQRQPHGSLARPRSLPSAPNGGPGAGPQPRCRPGPAARRPPPRRGRERSPRPRAARRPLPSAGGCPPSSPRSSPARTCPAGYRSSPRSCRPARPPPAPGGPGAPPAGPRRPVTAAGSAAGPGGRAGRPPPATAAARARRPPSPSAAPAAPRPGKPARLRRAARPPAGGSALVRGPARLPAGRLRPDPARHRRLAAVLLPPPRRRAGSGRAGWRARATRRHGNARRDPPLPDYSPRQAPPHR